jgi:hypothetical protein
VPSLAPTPTIVVDEHAAAAAIGLSVGWIRKDRRTRRLIPFYRIGGAIRYDLDRVRQALGELEEGGPAASSSRPERPNRRLRSVR